MTKRPPGLRFEIVEEPANVADGQMIELPGFNRRIKVL